MPEYFDHLAKDKKLRKLLDVHGPFTLKKEKDLCIYLCGSIMSQQLSTKVAKVIYNRFLELYGGNKPGPEEILSTSPETLRAIGLSNAKVNYVQNVATFAVQKGMSHKIISKMSDDEVIDYLTEIKGVGRWTVEMLLMFALQREDVFPADDLGIQQAMIGLYKLNNENKKQFKEEMFKIAKKWSPYRTYASLHLWRWKDAIKENADK
jgi:DNA-3-methyladenine glycosylase II